MTYFTKQYCVVIVGIGISLMCDGAPLTSVEDSAPAGIKDSHPMLASLFNVANNVPELTGDADIGLLLPVTTSSQQITNLVNNTKAERPVIAGLSDSPCELCRQQKDKECINRICFNTDLHGTVSPSAVVNLAIPMDGFEKLFIGTGSLVRLDTSSVLNDSTQHTNTSSADGVNTSSADGVSRTGKANALEIKPTTHQPEKVSLESTAQESKAQLEVIVKQDSHSEAAAKVMQMMRSTHDVPLVNSTSIDVKEMHTKIPRAHDMFPTRTAMEGSAVASNPVDQQLEIQVQSLPLGPQGPTSTNDAHSGVILNQPLTTSTEFPTIPPRRNAELQNFGKNFLSGLQSSLRSKS